eukprot:GHVL01011449.1.p1 GENE.GHVL01011449.1~~GHVL01011449.1.p1  ORF type:complete len:248 (-),score=11.03 GHVL01011449.1:311-1054(-)
MSTKSGHDLEPGHHQEKHHHGDGHGGKHHHGDHGKPHHGDHAKQHHGEGHGGKHHQGHLRHPPLRDAVMKAGKGEGTSTHGGGVERRSRAGTLTRRDTGHGIHAKHPKSHHDHDRQSVGKQSDGHAPSLVEYENTYKLEPDSRFQETQIREIIAKVLKENLTDNSYDARVMSHRCLELSEIIKERVKLLDMHRFKIVCMVIIGQNSEQSMMVSSRCLWNFAHDNFATFTLKKELYYAVGMVFVTYAE